MKLRTDPLVLAVALGLLNPSVFEVESDTRGESEPPPMLRNVADGAQQPVNDLDAGDPEAS